MPVESRLIADIDAHIITSVVASWIGVPLFTLVKDEQGMMLIDDTEKAHRNVSNLLYPVFNRGLMRDGTGWKIDICSMVIMK